MRYLSRKFLFASLFLLFLFLLCLSPAVVRVTQNCLDSIFQGLFPSLFPFLYFGAFLSELAIGMRVSERIDRWMRRLFSLSANALMPWFIGLFCGFPSGALAVLAAYRAKELTAKEARRLLLFVNTPSPAFCISFLGVRILNSPTLGALVYLSCALSSPVIAGVYARWSALDPKSEPSNTVPMRTLSEALLHSTARAIRSFATLSALYIGAQILWYLPGKALSRAVPALSIFLSGLIDAVGGCSSLSGFPTISACLSASIFLSAEGVCVFLQSLEALKETGTNIVYFWLTRLFACVISFIFMIFSLKILGYL